MKQDYLEKIVSLALAEDIGKGDVTTNHLISQNTNVQAHIIFKTEGIVCGLPVIERVFKRLNPKVSIRKFTKEGQKVQKNKIVAVIKGPARAILTGERVALNFLTHLSAIASRTHLFVEQVKPYRSKILDTRKTTPLLRELERYAVRIGGGENHRFDLSAMAMIKDNHRFMLKQGLKDSVEIIKSKTNKAVELEVDTWSEFEEALTSKAEIILLDNMTPAQVKRCVTFRNKFKKNVLLEASGGINLKNVKAYAKTGVERISIGSLTSIIEGIDISLDFNL